RRGKSAERRDERPHRNALRLRRLLILRARRNAPETGEEQRGRRGDQGLCDHRCALHEKGELRLSLRAGARLRPAHAAASSAHAARPSYAEASRAGSGMSRLRSLCGVVNWLSCVLLVGLAVSCARPAAGADVAPGLQATVVANGISRPIQLAL